MDRTRIADYAYGVGLAVFPAVVAWLVGAHETVTLSDVEFAGYWRRANWMSHIGFLPLTLYLFRWGTNKIMPVLEAWPPKSAPEIVKLIETEKGREMAYARLRRTLLSPWNLLATLAIVVAIHIVDMWDLMWLYIRPEGGLARAREMDWSIFFLASDATSRWENFLLVLFAYVLQFLIVTFLVLFCVLMLRHNLFFLRRVHQRHRVAEGEEEATIVIDLDDPNRCFGFRGAGAAFDTQVLCLMAAGLGVLTSRFSNVEQAQVQGLYNFLSSIDGSAEVAEGLAPAAMFPDAGQWIISLIWLSGLTIVALLALVKLLPRVPWLGNEGARRSIVSYLREFLPDHKWTFGERPSAETIDRLAAKFARNAFWPTGNNRAAQLFFFSFWCFLVMLFPLLPETGKGILFVGFHAVLVACALGATAVTFQLFKWSLAYIDGRLVWSDSAVFLLSGDGLDSRSHPASGPASIATAAGSSDLARRLEPGFRLGEYEILGLLGSGGMSEVYAARDRGLGREVAIKVLLDSFSKDPQRMARFEREARVLATLNHPKIATIFSFEHFGESRYIVMERVDGESLAERLTRGPLTLGEALEITIEVTGALEQAHARGVVHRDLKPGNIMMTGTGAKLLDFGVAKLQSGSQFKVGSTATTASPITQTGGLVGTFQYMAPEQLGGATVDARADLFSLGAVLYEMIMGRRAFNGDSIPSLFTAILHSDPTQLSDGEARLPRDVEAVLARCLAKKVEDRWQSAKELGDELARVLRALGRERDVVRDAKSSPVIVVLPFEGSSVDSSYESLLDDLTQDVIARLSPPLPVAGRDGPFDWQHEARELKKLAGEHVRLALKGVVTESEQRMKVTLELVDTDTGRTVWVRELDRGVEDSLALQGDLSEVVLSSLKPTLQSMLEEPDSLTEAGPD